MLLLKLQKYLLDNISYSNSKPDLVCYFRIMRLSINFLCKPIPMAILLFLARLKLLTADI